jgi:hypothetical protein
MGQFAYVSYPSVGESYQSPSPTASAQRLVNMYPEVIKGGNGLTPVVAHNFPGLDLQVSGASGEYDRGAHMFQGTLYVVSGAVLYSVSSGYTRTAIGSIAGVDRVSMSDNGTLMVIVTNGFGEYTYDGTTLTATTLGQNPSNVEYLNKQFFYDDDDGRVGISSIGGTSVPSGNYFKPESDPDVLVRTYIFNQFIYVFSGNTIEPWQPSIGLPPVERMNGSIIENTGLAGKDAIANTEQAIYFIDQNGDAQQLQGFSPKQITTVAVANSWKGYTFTDALVQTVTLQSLDFVIFSFPTDGKTWGYVEQYDMWFELEHGTAGARWLGGSILRAYSKNVVCDYSSGNLYELDTNTFTDNGEVTVRERIFAPLAGEKLNKPRQMFQLNELGVSLETGIGNSLETNPLLAIAVSSDGGKTFSNEKFKQLGQQGEYVKDVKYSTNKHFKDLTVRLRYTEPTKFSLFSAYVKVRESGRQ